MSYSNFKDPVGLAKRMILSGNKAAWFTLFREGLGIIFKPIDSLLSIREKKLLKSNQKSDLPLILILGGSRSGTTIFYQTLTQYLPVSYFNNLSVSFPKSPITSWKLFHPLLRRQRGNFENYYGSVAGFNGPNDGFHIWNRWFGEDRNHIPESISQEAKNEILQFFHTWHSVTDKPFLNKNNRNSLCAPLLDRLFDRIIFIEIRRDPVYVVQSLIQSREAVQGSKHIAWGLNSKDSGNSDSGNYIREICHQVLSVENILDEAQKAIQPDKYFRISYEEFCDNPRGIVQKFSRIIMGNPQPEENLRSLKPLQNTNKQKLSDEEFSSIIEHIGKLKAEKTSTLNE